MTRTFVAKGMEIVQQDLQQILLRGKGDGSFADTVNKEVSLLRLKKKLKKTIDLFLIEYI